MTEKAPALTDPPEGYAEWLADLKGRIHAAQQRAALAVNAELVQLYGQIGRDILDRQAEQAIVQGPLARLPWYHQLALLEKHQTSDERIWYAAKAIGAWRRGPVAFAEARAARCRFFYQSATQPAAGARQ